MRVLLVEDDTMIGQSLSQALESNGWSVDWVRDGQLAQSALDDGGYACVLLDLGLPMALHLPLAVAAGMAAGGLYAGLVGVLKELHELSAFAMAGLVLLHVAGALKHHFIDRDATLVRMFGRTGK